MSGFFVYMPYYSFSKLFMVKKTIYMAVNVRLFETEEEFESVYISEEYVEDWVSYTENTKKVKYNKTKYEKMLETPLTFEIESDGDIFWVSQSSGFTKTISYKKNDGDWIEITSTADENPPKISVVAGDKVQFKGNGGYYHSGLDKNVSFFRNNLPIFIMWKHFITQQCR